MMEEPHYEYGHGEIDMPQYPKPNSKPSCYIEARCTACPYNRECGNANKKV